MNFKTSSINNMGAKVSSSEGYIDHSFPGGKRLWFWGHAKPSF